jgi:hypothetical protein
MYLVKIPELVKSMEEKAKAPEHKIKASFLEYDELKIIIKMTMLFTNLSI